MSNPHPDKVLEETFATLPITKMLREKYGNTCFSLQKWQLAELIQKTETLEASSLAKIKKDAEYICDVKYNELYTELLYKEVAKARQEATANERGRIVGILDEMLKESRILFNQHSEDSQATYWRGSKERFKEAIERISDNQ